EFEREVFGSKQVGAQRRLIDADLSAILAGIEAPSAKSLDKGIEDLSRNTALSNQLEARNEAATFLDKLSTINPLMIQGLSTKSLRQTRKEIEEQRNFQELQYISGGLDSIKDILDEVMKIVGGLASD